MKKLFLILTAAALSFVGCKSVSPSNEGASVEGASNKNASTATISIEGDWQTSKLEIDGVEQELCPSEMSIKQKDGDLYSINGDSGVNRFFGDVKVSGSSFKAQDNIGSTRMAGDPVSMKFEDNFTDALLSATSWETFQKDSSTFLKISDKDGKRAITFTKK